MIKFCADVMLIHEAAVLRTKGDYQHSIHLLEARLPEMAPECLPSAYLELFYSAIEAGRPSLAKHYALRLSKFEPVPQVVTEYLRAQDQGAGLPAQAWGDTQGQPA